MWSVSSLVIMIAMKPLLGYVLHPVGVEICRDFCCQVTGKPFCVYSPTALLCQVTRRKRLPAGQQWIILEIPIRHPARYEAKTTTCPVHSRLHRSRTRGVKCVAVSSKPKCNISYDLGVCTSVDSRASGKFQKKNTKKHPPPKRKSHVWPRGIREDYNKYKVGNETIFIKRIHAELSWDSANKACKGDGAQLVIVDDEETESRVMSLFTDFETLATGYIWIGMRDLCDNNTYLWLDGKAPTYTKWARNEPTRHDEEGRPEKCVKLSYTFADVTWHSASCSSQHGFICQLLLPDASVIRERLRNMFNLS